MQKTKIEWAQQTWNPLRGTKGIWHCTKVSDGCKNCYAERLNVRFGGPKFQVGADTLRFDYKIAYQPKNIKKPRTIFVCSMTDIFHDDVKGHWLYKIFEVMRDSPQHTFQILTKRPKEMHRWCTTGYLQGVNLWPLPNVWLGVSVENQETADERIPILLDTPAAVRWVSAEPLLGEIDFEAPQIRALSVEVDHREDVILDWVVVGGGVWVSSKANGRRMG